MALVVHPVDGKREIWPTKFVTQTVVPLWLSVISTTILECVLKKGEK